MGATACLERPAADILVLPTTVHHARVLFHTRHMALYSLQHSKQVRYSLYDLLSHFRWSMATNPRDKIYGLLGMANNGSEHPLTNISYSEDIEQCYRTSILEEIKSSGSLDILQLCRKPSGLKEVSKSDFPSWLPDLALDASDLDSVIELSCLGRFGLQSSSVAKELALKPRVFHASNGSAEHSPLLQGGRQLIVQGVHFDTIKVLGEMMTSFEARSNPILQKQWDHIRQLRNKTYLQGYKDSFRAAVSGLKGWPQSLYQGGDKDLLMMDWRRLALSQGENYPTGESNLEAFISTVHKGWLGDNPESTVKKYNAEWDRVYSKMDAVDQSFLPKRLGRRSKPRLGIAGLIKNTLTLLKGMEIKMYGYTEYLCFAVTELGYFALVPPETCEGDTIAILKGGPVPFIIRPRERDCDEPDWELVGPCYVHGIMHGEQWNEQLCRPIRLV